jgi:hypothetical protein
MGNWLADHTWRILYASKVWHAEGEQFVRTGQALCGQRLWGATHYIPAGRTPAPTMIRACKKCMRKIPAANRQNNG